MIAQPEQPILRKMRLAAPVALAALVLLFFNKLAFSNLILARGDTYLYFYPYWTAAAEALRAGRVPYWNPDIFMGAPLLANSQAGFFYLLNWPLWLAVSTPYAVSASILIHIVIAGWGSYLAARRTLGVGATAALLAAGLFALGGYLTAQVEHINQLQGLAWLPWYFVALAPVVAARERSVRRSTAWRAIPAVAALLALQLLAGHTQTVFISGVSVAIWLLGHALSERSGLSRPVQLLATLVTAGLLAAMVTAVQLLPTLELIGQSSRQGGLTLNEVLSFSWHPVHLTRAILPPYERPLFSEYIAFVPITALALFFVGAWSWRRERGIAVWLLLVAVTLAFALGRFTPLYYVLGNLPGFDLFRVPARWLAPAALGVAMLAGAGWQRIDNYTQMMPADPSRRVAERSALRRPLIAAGVFIAALVLWGYLAAWTARFIPTGAEAPFESPTVANLLGWAGEAALALTLFGIALYGTGTRARVACHGLVVLVFAVLWLGSRQLPYNLPTTPEAYFDLRPPAARLLARATCAVPDRPCPTPPDRTLSLSDIFFDLGDQAEIDAIYADQLSPAARYDYTIAVKHKEVLSPNLSMQLGLPSVDGFDGGILPLRDYVALMRLVLPTGANASDGRLREYLSAIPETRLLALFNARFVITDKVGDSWRDGVYFDRQLPVVIADDSVPVGDVPPFEASELRLLSDGTPPQVEVITASGENWRLSPEPTESPDMFRLVFPTPAVATAVTLLPCSEAESNCRVEAISLVDSRDGTFLSLVPGPMRMIYSGDVKIYENPATLPRAYQVFDWQWFPDAEAVLAAMARPDFDPQSTAGLIGDGDAQPMPPGAGSGKVLVTDYTPERVALRAEADRESLVVLSDTFYPGWRVTVDGEPTLMLRANGLFRGVLVPPGAHEIVFTYRPSRMDLGITLTLVGLAILAGSITVMMWRARPLRRSDQRGNVEGMRRT